MKIYPLNTIVTKYNHYTMIMGVIMEKIMADGKTCTLLSYMIKNQLLMRKYGIICDNTNMIPLSYHDDTIISYL